MFVCVCVCFTFSMRVYQFFHLQLPLAFHSCHPGDDRVWGPSVSLASDALADTHRGEDQGQASPS